MQRKGEYGCDKHESEKSNLGTTSDNSTRPFTALRHICYISLS